MKLICVVVVILVFVNENGIQAQGIEGVPVCSGEPENAPVSVECKCNFQSTTLEFKHEQLKDKFRQATNFTVSDCSDAVVFNIGSFKELHQLQNLEIHDVKKVVMRPGVFQHLDHLKIRNVQELEFKRSAFHGGQMKSVEISESNIDKLPKFSFHDIQALEKFVLFAVKIGEIEPNAISLKNNSIVEIVNVTVEKIAAKGIEIEANSVVMYRSHLNGLADDSVNLTAKSQLVISQTEFGENLYNSPIHAMAPIVNISNNHFHYLNKGILKHITGISDGSILFIDNNIEDFESEQPLEEPPSTWTIRGNQFKCTCKFLEAFRNLADSTLVQNNFCRSTCMLPLKIAAEKCSQDPDLDMDDQELLCKGYTTMRPLMTTHRSREGRGHDMTDNSTTTADEHKAENSSYRKVASFGPFFWALMTLMLLF